MYILGIVLCSIKTLILIISIRKILLFFNGTAKIANSQTLRDYWNNSILEEKEALIVGLFGFIYVFISCLITVIVLS